MNLSTLSSIAFCIITVMFITCLILLFFKAQKKRQNRFAAHFKSPSRAHKQVAEPTKPLSKQLQSCSYCKRKVKSKELTFYSAPNQVIGVCRSCRPQAERQDFHRL